MARIPLAAVLLALLAGSPARSEPDPLAILEKADEATRSVKSVVYTSEFAATGFLAANARKLSGTVTTERPHPHDPASSTVASDARVKRTIEADLTPPGAQESQRIVAARDGEQAIVINETRKTFTRGEPAAVAGLLWTVEPIVLEEYVAPAPFGDERKGRSVRYEGVQKVGEVECDVIHVVYDTDGAPEARWYFGREDSLPRRVDRIVPGGDATYSITITRLEVDPEIDPGVYRPSPPAGFEEEAPSPRKRF